MLLSNYKLIGALTSKPYAFMARSWELKTFESIDIFDNLGSNIRIDVRNFEILRILPKFNYSLNEDWITDKVRFCYDGLRKQRLSHPLFKKNKTLLPISWENAFIKVKEVLNSEKFEIESFIGNIVDYETLVVYKSFLNSLGVSNSILNNYKHSLNLNNRNDYLLKLTNKNLLDLNNLILINLNLRLENPILNLKIRKNVLKNSLKVFNFGFNSNLTYSFKNYGINIYSFLSFLEGNSSLTSFLINNKNYFLLGSSILSRKDNKFFINSIKNLMNKILFTSEYSIFFTGSNTLTQLELNMSSSVKNVINSTLKKNKPKIAYLLDMDDIYFNKKKYDFVIYQGHHGDINVYNSDLVLPGILPYEKSSTFINTYGFVQQSINTLLPLNLVKSKNDWEIIKGLGDFMGFFIPFYSPKDFKDYMNKYITKNNKLLSSNLNDLDIYQTIFFNNYSNINYFGNYYLTNSISRASLVMGLCAYRFKFNNFY